MKIEALTKKMNDEVRGKCPKEEKLRALISETVQRAGCAALAGGEPGDPSSTHAILLATGCQMLWNALEDAKAEIERLKKEADEAYDMGYSRGSDEAEYEHAMGEGA